MPANMNALMDALKRKEGSAGLDGLPSRPAASAIPGKPTGATSESDPAADPDTDVEPQPDPADNAENNAKIVDILQNQYPKIYDKISQMVQPDELDEPQSSSDVPAIDMS